jgi:membrane-bound metal-dependent hydrolase YbcI (DUF457 family)
MMVVTHGLSGYVLGRVAMPVLRRHSPLSPAAMSWAFFLGAMMPDGDFVTRLLLGTSAYFSNHWYGHRQASHSILGTFLLAGAVALIGYLPWLSRAGDPLVPEERRRTVARSLAWAWACLWCGGLLHLVGDLPTPGMSLVVFWPFPERFGSWSHIGWFTPYLLWMFISAVLLGGAMRWTGRKLVSGGWVRTGIYVSAAAWVVYALAFYRWLHYLMISRYESAPQYAAVQQDLLPDVLNSFSTEWVRTVWRWMTY